MLPLLLGLALVATPPADDSAPPELLAALRDAPAGGARADAATRPLLGVRYLLSPLGEGQGVDPDPRFRLDAFDCMTFAETAMALGSASSLEEARRALDEIRYHGPIDFDHRSHEVLSQWLPANVAKGWLAPVARQAAGPAVGVAAVTYDETRWERVRRAGQEIRGLSPGAYPTGRFEVEVVPPDRLASVAGRIPPGTVVLVVRADRPDRATRVTHMGLVVAGPAGGRLVRHASSSRGVARVIEEPVGAFVAGQRRALRWPLTGFALYAIQARPAPSQESGPILSVP